MKKDECTELEKEFARQMVEGKLKGRDAYRKASRRKDLKDSTCDVNASKLLKKAKVKKYIDELNAKLDDEAIMSKRERMIWLTRVVKTQIREVGSDSDLCQEYSITSGEDFETTKFKMPSKLGAIAEMNKMDGAYEPEKVEVVTKLSFGSLLSDLPDKPIVDAPQ